MVRKPSEKEEEFFKKMQLEKNKKKQQEAEQGRQAQLKDLNNLNCPHCNLKLSDRSDNTFKMASCNSCQGIWLPGDTINTLLAEEKGGLLQSLKGLLKK